MLLAHSDVLWLLLLSPLAAWMALRARRNAPARPRWSAALTRAAAVAALVLAIARPILVTRTTPAPTTVVTIDLGPGVGAADIARVRESLRSSTPDRVVVFSNRAAVLDDQSVLDDPKRLATLRGELATAVWADDPASGGSDLAAALRLAGAQFPDGGQGEVRLFTHGLTSGHGDAAAEAWRLSTRGIGVRVTPLDVALSALPPVRVSGIDLPASGRVGQGVAASVRIEAAVETKVRLRCAVGDGEPVFTTVTVGPGLSTLPVTLPLAAPGLLPVTAGVERADAIASDAAPPQRSPDAPADAPPDVPAVRAAIDVAPAGRVLVVEQGDDRTASTALRTILGASAEVDRVDPAALAGLPSDDAGLVVLSDVPADALAGATQQKLRDAVLHGTGLLMTGVGRSFGPGGYATAPLAALLPVRMPQQAEDADPSTALVLIIDTSGSMQGLPIDLAKEVARAAVSHLRAHDKVGVVEFYGGKRWAAPITSAANGAVIDRAIDRLNADGSTVLYSAVEEAAFALSNVVAQSKHVLILSDGGVEDAAFPALVRRMVDDGISVSTVLCGPGDEGPKKMKDIARAGHGRFYSVPDQYALPDISLKQPSLSPQSSVVLTPAAVEAGDDALVRGAGATDWPAVGGYVRTEAKPTADVLLKTTDGDPLLARWRYGSGFVAALTTQLGSTLTRDLDARPAFGALLKSLVRQIDTARTDRLTVTPLVRPGGIEVDAATADVSSPDATGALRVVLSDERGNVLRTLSTPPSSLGHWNAWLPGVTAGVYRVTAALESAGRSASAGVAVPRPLAVPAMQPDRALLDRLGRFVPADVPLTADAYLDLRKPMAAAAVVFLLLHIAARRWKGAVA